MHSLFFAGPFAPWPHSTFFCGSFLLFISLCSEMQKGGWGEGEGPFVSFQVVSHEKPEYTPRLPPRAICSVSLASAEYTWISLQLPLKAQVHTNQTKAEWVHAVIEMYKQVVFLQKGQLFSLWGIMGCGLWWTGAAWWLSLFSPWMDSYWPKRAQVALCALGFACVCFAPK